MSAATKHQATLLVHDRLSLRLAGTRRIPRAAWAEVSEAARLVEQTNALWLQAQQQAEDLRETARREGYAQGGAEALAELGEALSTAVQRIREDLRGDDRRVAALALAVVRRIAPSLDAMTVVPDLVSDALASIDVERYLVVRVHPDVREAAAARLEHWHEAHPEVGALRVIADESLERLDCVVESEMGQIRAGLADQLRLIGDALQSAIDRPAGA